MAHNAFEGVAEGEGVFVADPRGDGGNFFPRAGEQVGGVVHTQTCEVREWGSVVVFQAEPPQRFGAHTSTACETCEIPVAAQFLTNQIPEFVESGIGVRWLQYVQGLSVREGRP